MRSTAALAASLAAAPVGAGEPAVDVEFFEKQIRPILATHCYECHSAEAESLEAGLLLDRRAGLVDGGDSGAAIDLDDPAASLLLEAVRYESFEMPPDGKLSDDKIALLARWIEGGAPWPDEPAPEAHGPKHEEFDLDARRTEHWAWQPVVDPPLPQVSDPSWARDPIDHFVLAKLDEYDLKPSPATDRRTLYRRLSFALTGLPPDPQDVEEFVSDPDDNAREKVVDRLLASPAFGERWGRHWLDLVRYADTRGHEFDYAAPHAYHYRDYVIRALNADVPYDQLVVEHVAGDLMERPRLHSKEGFNESIIGTGFWHLGDWVHSPVDTRKDEADRVDNMVDVASKTFLGLTVACARCHDHKFDAISTADFYAMSGYLQSSSYRLARIDGWLENQKVADELAEFDQRSNERLRKALVNLLEGASSRLGDYITAAVALSGEDGSTPKRQAINAAAKEHSLDSVLLRAWTDEIADLRQQPDAELAVLLELAKETAVDDTAESINEQLPIDSRLVVDFGDLAPHAWRQDGHSFGARPVRTGDFLVQISNGRPKLLVQTVSAARRDPAWEGLEEIDAFRDANTSQLHKFPRAGRTLRTPTFTLKSGTLSYDLRGGCRIFLCVNSHRMILGPLNGESMLDVKPDEANQRRWVRHNLQRFVGQRVHVEFTTRDDGPLEVYRVVDGEPPPQRAFEGKADVANLDGNQLVAAVNELRTLLAAGKANHPTVARAADWTARHAHLLAEWNNASLAEYVATIADHADQRAEIADGIVRSSRVAMASLDGSPEDEFLMIRGNHLNPGDQVPRRFLTALGAEGPGERCTGSGRMQLAESIIDTTNPLTYRVVVNRVWKHLFGRGIVASPDDFGVLGQRPTHPELLDHLATRFVAEHQFSLKRLIRSIVLSQAYQMSSDVSPTVAEVDPENLWLSRFNVMRLEGEAVRDSILAVSGRLDPTMFGPPVPIHLTSFMQGRGRPDKSGPLDGAGRRSIYLSVRRNFLIPMMTAYDAPPPSTTQGRRNVSNVPAQSLILLNDPFVRQQAERWANSTIKAVESPKDRIRTMYLQAFARPPTDRELESLLRFVESRGAEEGVVEHSTWTEVALVLMNVKEFTLVF